LEWFSGKTETVYEQVTKDPAGQPSNKRREDPVWEPAAPKQDAIVVGGSA
jgi:hypothetical protein